MTNPVRADQQLSTLPKTYLPGYFTTPAGLMNMPLAGVVFFKRSRL